MRVRPGVELAGLSDVGCQRENNEDRYSYWEPADDSQFPAKGRLAIVADGMGGYEGGQEASRIAVEAIEEAYANGGVGNPRSWLLEGFQAAHHRIQEYADNYGALTDARADTLAHRALDLEGRRTELKTKYYDRLRMVVAPKVAARFIQIENQLLLLLDLQIAASLPIVE